LRFLARITREAVRCILEQAVVTGLILFNEFWPAATGHIVPMKPLHILLMIITTAAWGLNFIATRVVLDVFSPEQLAFARACISLAVLLPWWQPWRRVSVKFLAAAFPLAVSYYVCTPPSG
jgi:hypothetical protein